jgi:hypothetical protein
MTRQPITIHGRDHAPGGADPIPGGGGTGIDFNKTNEFDATGTEASYFDIYMTGPDPGLVIGSRTFAFRFRNTGITGDMSIINDGDGVISFENYGYGTPFSYGTGYSTEYGQTLSTDGKEYIGFLARQDGGSHASPRIRPTVLIGSTSGQTRLYNAEDGILLWSSGADFNGVGIKLTPAGSDFLIQGGETVTRNGTYGITAMTPTNPAVRVRPGSPTGLWFYGLPTSASGLTTGQVWNSSGVLHVV